MQRNLPPGGLLSLTTGWRLAQGWSQDRLDAFWRRKTLEEAQQIFEELGLASPYWQLGA
jgi:hypothetical protein